MIVITGGGGFIGSALIWGFNLRGYDDILVVDALGSDEKWKNLVPLKFNDFINKDKFIETLEQGGFGDSITGIIHMGACSSTTQKDADFLLQNNFEYTKRLALWSIKQNKRFVYASSAATYGDGKIGFSDDHSILHQLNALNMYAYSKQLFDLWALQNGMLSQIAGLKYFNVFGPNEYHKEDMRSVIYKAFEQIKTTGCVKLFKSYHPTYKDGGQMRDFIYIKDVVEMTIFIYNSPSVGIFNIGTGKARSFYDLVITVFNSMGKNPSIEYVDMPVSIRDKYQYFTEADISKLCTMGYDKKNYSLEEAISDYIQNYLVADYSCLGKRGGCYTQTK